MAHGKIKGNQSKIASAAAPVDKITGADFKALRKKKPNKAQPKMAAAMGYKQPKDKEMA